MDKYEGHTPGPWGIDRIAATHVVAAGGRGICSTGAYSTNQEHPDKIASENEANAHLIADAPLLLRQREELLEALNKIQNIRHSEEHALLMVDDIAIHAMAKVESEMVTSIITKELKQALQELSDFTQELELGEEE
jgi:hypothetical protein